MYFRVVATLIELGREIGCYKITLNCKDDLVKWYNGFGLKCEPGNANFMTIRIPNEPKSMLWQKWSELYDQIKKEIMLKTNICLYLIVKDHLNHGIRIYWVE